MHEEFELLINCCRVTGDDKYSEAAMAEIDWRSIDWNQFLNLVRDHKLTAHVHRNLKRVAPGRVPQHVLIALREGYDNNVRRLLASAAELVRLVKMLDAEGISSISIKGPLLSMQLFDDVGVRESHDLDILVDPEHVEWAERVLRRESYDLVFPKCSLTQRQYHYHRRWCKDFSYWNNDKQSWVELHWKLNSRLSFSPASPELAGQLAELSFFGSNITHLAPMFNLIYLCSHGSEHGWSRLFWLIDIAAFMGRYGDDIDWMQLLVLSKRLNATRPLVEAVVVAHRLLGSHLPAAIDEEFQKDKMIAWLVGQTTEGLKKLRSPIDGSSLSSTQRLLSLHHSLSYKKSVLLQRWRPTYDDWDAVHLPDLLFGLYYVLRPLLVLGRKFKIIWVRLFWNEVNFAESGKVKTDAIRP